MTTRRYLVARALRGNPQAWERYGPARQEPWLRWADRALDALDIPGGNMPKQKLVEDWRNSWRWWSMRLNAFAAVGIGLALNNLDAIASVLAMAPPEIRSFIPIPVSVLIFATVAGVRLYKQNHK